MDRLNSNQATRSVGKAAVAVIEDAGHPRDHAVHHEIKAWQSRPLEACYAIVSVDAIRMKIRDEGIVRNKAVYLAIGVRCCGHKEIPGLWVEQTEGAKFALTVRNELKAPRHGGNLDRGRRRTGFPEAIEAVFPQTLVQTGIVHLIRYPLSFGSWKECKTIVAALKPIYKAIDAYAANAALDVFDAGPWGEKYPNVAASWRPQPPRLLRSLLDRVDEPPG